MIAANREGKRWGRLAFLFALAATALLALAGPAYGRASHRAGAKAHVAHHAHSRRGRRNWARGHHWRHHGGGEAAQVVAAPPPPPPGGGVTVLPPAEFPQSPLPPAAEPAPVEAPPTEAPPPAAEEPAPPAEPPAEEPAPPNEGPALEPPAEGPKPPAKEPAPPSEEPAPPAEEPAPPAEEPVPPGGEPSPPIEKPTPPAGEPAPPAEQPTPPKEEPPTVQPPTEQPPAEEPAPPAETPAEVGGEIFLGNQIRDFHLNQSAPGAITEVPDPLDPSRTVMQMTVANSDVYPITPTADPRAQLLSPDIFEPGDEYWWNSEFLLPAGFPASSPGWITLLEGPYGEPFEGTPPWHIEVNGNHLRWSRNGTYNWDIPWEAPLIRGSWVHVLVHGKFSREGWIEMWIDGQQITFFSGGTFNPNGEQPVKRLDMATIDASNDGHTNFAVIQSYRELGIFQSLTIFQGPMRIGETRASVGG